MCELSKQLFDAPFTQLEWWRLIALNANQVEWHKIKGRPQSCKSDAFGLDKHISTVCESDICQSDRKYVMNECSSSWATITPASTCNGKIYAHMSRHFVVLLLHSFVVKALRTCYSLNSNEFSLHSIEMNCFVLRWSCEFIAFATKNRRLRNTNHTLCGTQTQSIMSECNANLFSCTPSGYVLLIVWLCRIIAKS